MKKAILLGIATWFFSSCAVVVVEEEMANPVVVDHGVTEEIVGYEEITIGRHTHVEELVLRSYDITVRNDGSLPAYGLVTTLEFRTEYQDEFYPYDVSVSFHEEELYMTDVLEPGWELTLSYELAFNEEVTDFLGITWDDWDTYSANLKSNGEHYTGLAKKGTQSKIKITKKKVK